MFQNIENKDQEQVTNKKKINLKEFFKIGDIIVDILSLMISAVSFNTNLAPFGIAMFAAICSNRIPVGFAYIALLLGTFLGFGINGLLTFLITSILFISLIVIFKPIVYDTERNEKQKLGLCLFISILLVQAVKIMKSGFLLYDILTSLVLAIISYIFYKIFTNSISVIRKFSFKNIYAIEEVMGACLLIAISFCALNKIQIFSLSITNILSIMLVLFMGWQNGILIGGTAGITIGMTLAIVNNGNPILIAAYAISGLIAGILNRFGKIGVIIGFFIGNAILTYIYKGNTAQIITIREILIASLGLLLLPKNISINIDDLYKQNKCVPTKAGVLDGDKETVYKLNTVSETISKMAESYDEAAKDLSADNEDETTAEESFKQELLNNIEDFPDNVLYENIVENDEAILSDIYEYLEKENEINKDDLIDILNKNNNYILGIDSQDEEIKEKIEKDIKDIVKTINATYRINKLNIVWKQKEASNKKVLASQLGGVSKVISSLAEDIKEKPLKEEKEERFGTVIGKATVTKNKSKVSGDSHALAKLQDGKYMIAISDGMGSRRKGKQIKQNSDTDVKRITYYRI